MEILRIDHIPPTSKSYIDIKEQIKENLLMQLIEKRDELIMGIMSEYLSIKIDSENVAQYYDRLTIDDILYTNERKFYLDGILLITFYKVDIVITDDLITLTQEYKYG